ncbi:MAG: hypothetical protein RL033_2305, partial [Pseudomonadota bacterium]
MKHDASSPPQDPPRLLGGGSARERQLLQSARWDAAPSGARERMAAALGPVLADAPTLPGGSEASPGQLLRAAASRSGAGMFTPRSALVGLAGAGIAAYLLASLLGGPTAVSPQRAADLQLAPSSD